MAFRRLRSEDLTFPEAGTPQLQVESWSNAWRNLEVRGFCKDGFISFDHGTLNTRGRQSDIFDVPDVPISIQVSPKETPVLRGECYVRLTLLMGGFPVGRLSAGYLTDGKTMSWPPGIFEGFTEGPGKIHMVTGTDPLAGNQVIETVPTNCRWRLISMQCTLVTDATVIDRVVGLLLDDGTVVYMRQDAITAQPASTTVWYYWGQGLLVEETGLQWTEPLPWGIIMPEGHRIRVFATNFQAGDDYMAPNFLVEEWIEE